MPYGGVYSGIGQGLENAGANIADAIRARQKRKIEEQEEANRKNKERVVAKMRLSARGIPWKPDYDQTIESGGSSEDIINTATEESERKKAEAEKARQPEVEATVAQELMGAGIAGPPNPQQQMEAPLLAKAEPATRLAAIRQARAEREKTDKEMTRRQNAKAFKMSPDIAEAYITEEYTLAQALTAMKQPKEPKPLDTTADNRSLYEIAEQRKLLDPAAQNQILQRAQKDINPKPPFAAQDRFGNPIFPTDEGYNKELDTRVGQRQKQIEGESALQIKEEAIRKNPKGTTGYPEDQGGGGDPEMDALEAELQQLIDEYRRLRGGS